MIASRAQAAAAHGLHVLAMAYGYASIDLFTSTYNTSVASPAPSSSFSTQLMNSGSSSGNVLGFVEKEKAHLVFARFAPMLETPRKGVKDSVALLQSRGS